MKKHIIAAVATMAVFGAFSTTANAAWTGGSANINIATQLTAKTSQTATANPVYTDATTLPLGGSVTFSLTNGATFVGAATAAAAGTATLGQLGLSTGTSTAKFTVTTAGTGGAITLTPGNINLSAVPVGGLVDITYETRDSLNNLIIGPVSLDANTGIPGTPLFTMVDALTATLTAKTDQAAVAKAYKVTSSGTVGTPLNGSTTGVVLTSGTGVDLTTADNALITLTGNFAGIGSVSGTSIKGSTAAGSTAAGTAGFFTIDAAAGKAYAVTTAAITGAGLNIAPVFVWDAVTPQIAREGANAFTVKVDGIAGTTPTLTYPIAVQAATVIYSTTRDGTSFKLNTLSVNDLIRLTNNDGAAAAMNITAGDAATGANVTAAAGAPALAATIPAGGTIVVTGADLLANFGNGAVFSFNIEATDVIAQQVHIVPGTGASTSVIRTGAGKTL